MLRSQPTIYGENNPSVTVLVVNYGFTSMSNGFGERLREKLEDAGMRAAELARRSGVTKQNIGRLLNQTPHSITGALPKAEEETVIKLATALGWDVNEALLAAGYAPRNGTRAKPQNAAEFAQRLADMGFEIQTDFNFEKLGPDDLQDVIDQIEANLLIKARRKAG
jgi:transcriptional regulator with XRE-family HTH domain